MRKRHKNYKVVIGLYIALMIFVGLLVIGSIGLYVFVMVNYGGKPVTEIPAWAFWFLQLRG